MCHKTVRLVPFLRVSKNVRGRLLVSLSTLALYPVDATLEHNMQIIDVLPFCYGIPKYFACVAVSLQKGEEANLNPPIQQLSSFYCFCLFYHFHLLPISVSTLPGYTSAHIMRRVTELHKREMSTGYRIEGMKWGSLAISRSGN